MMRLAPQARDALVRLRDDTDRSDLFGAVARTLRQMGAPTDLPRARPERWHTPWGQACATPITTDHDRWLAVYQHDNAHVAVLYLGPHTDAAHT